ncbi:MAG: oxygen-independent coproporphyrinogen III oxidase [Pseudomonadales bacterium]
MSTTTAIQATSHWDTHLLKKYDMPGPRYTSYPTANVFDKNFDAGDYRALAAKTHANISPLSLYVHIPFCENICYYCACNKVVTRKRHLVRPFLDHLEQELELRGALHKKRRVTQLHFGGGTPTYLDPAELTELMHHIGTHFNLDNTEAREFSIEIDPRTISKSTVALLKGLNFNRISIGIQDFDPLVQRAVNRLQSYEMVKGLTHAIRRHNYRSLSFDLIYGLPMQSVASYADTMDKVIELQPDRIACYNYAHLPERFSSQRAIDRLQLPNGGEKLAMFQYIGERLLAAGYDYIGMDHFVRPDDELAIARKDGRLQRNFQGYSTCLAPDLIGLGPSAISQFNGSYSQNHKDLETYYQALDENDLPIANGCTMSQEDHLRRKVIMNLACQLRVDIPAIEQEFGIVFTSHFKKSLINLEPLSEDGLVIVGPDEILVTQAGRMLIRNICMAFDAHLTEQSQQRFSRTI